MGGVARARGVRGRPLTRALRAALFGVALAFAAAVAAGALSAPAAMDFIAQYAAARLVASGEGAAILDPEAVRAAERSVAPERVRLLPFVQTPAIALLLAPLATLPFGSAFAAMAIVDAVLILAAASLMRRRGTALAPVLLIVVAPPAALAVAHGQTSPLVLLLVALAMRLGPRAAGLALGLTLLRPQTAPLLLLAAIVDPQRRWWAAIGAGAVLAASAAVVGLDGLPRYVALLAGAAEWSATGEHGLRTAIGWGGPALSLGWGRFAIAAATVSLVFGAVAVVRAAPGERVATAALWSILASPHALMHDALLAYPVVLALASRGALWDAGSVVAWLVHVLVAPFGVLWSLVLSIRALGYARRTG